MDEINKEQLMEKMIYSINDFKDEMVKSMNYIREDVKNLKQDMNDLKQDMNYLKQDMNDLKQDMNDLKQEVKDLRGELKEEISDLRVELREYKEENNKCWERYEANRKEDKKFLLDTLLEYDLSISKQLGDPNVEKMKKIV